MLSIETRLGCEDLNYFQATIEGSAQDYKVYCERGKWHCDCKSFQFRGSCKHVTEASKKRCTWSDDHDCEAKIVPVDDEHPLGKACPKCGGPVFSYKVGV